MSHEWQAHQQWLQQHQEAIISREQWTRTDWETARLAADTAWEHNPSGLYLYRAEQALRDQQYRRVQAGFDRDAVIHRMVLEALDINA